MIPRIAHYVWIGDSLPFTEMGNVIHFHKLHRDWKIMVWNKRNALELMTDREKKIIDGIQLPIHQANLIRFLALRAYGGVYMDLDILCLDHMDNVLHPNKMNLSNVWWYPGCSKANLSSYNNCFAAAKKGCDITNEITASITDNMEAFIGRPSHLREIERGYSEYPWPVSGIGAFYHVIHARHEEIHWLTHEDFVEMHTLQKDCIGSNPKIIHGASHSWKKPARPFATL